MGLARFSLASGQTAEIMCYIITNNVRHFAGSDSLGIRAITPAEALAILRTAP